MHNLRPLHPSDLYAAHTHVCARSIGNYEFIPAEDGLDHVGILFQVWRRCCTVQDKLQALDTLMQVPGRQPTARDPEQARKKAEV